MNRFPAYLRPAGQVSISFNPLPQGLSVQGFNAQMQPIMAAGLNSANQLVDATGALVLDASGRPISNPVSNATGSTPPAQTPAVIPTPVQTVATAADTTHRFLGGLFVTALLIGGAAYVGSYFGSKRAVRA